MNDFINHLEGTSTPGLESDGLTLMPCPVGTLRHILVVYRKEGKNIKTYILVVYRHHSILPDELPAAYFGCLRRGNSCPMGACAGDLPLANSSRWDTWREEARRFAPPPEPPRLPMRTRPALVSVSPTPMLQRPAPRCPPGPPQCSSLVPRSHLVLGPTSSSAPPGLRGLPGLSCPGPHSHSAGRNRAGAPRPHPSSPAVGRAGEQDRGTGSSSGAH